MIVSNGISGCGPLEQATFCAQPVPAQQTAMRSPPSRSAALLDRRLDLLSSRTSQADELEPELGCERLALLGVDVGDRDDAPRVRAARARSPRRARTPRR